MINVSIVKKENPQRREEPKKAYGVAQYSEKMSLAEFAEHISSHNSVYDKADVTAMLIKAVKCMKGTIRLSNSRAPPSHHTGLHQLLHVAGS